MENTNVLFDRKRLVRLIVPLIVEQVLAVTVGMADMVMVSGAGETAVSGISLVNTICVLLIVIFTSMASGGSVVGAQFLGSGDKKTACHAYSRTARYDLRTDCTTGGEAYERRKTMR